MAAAETTGALYVRFDGGTASRRVIRFDDARTPLVISDAGRLVPADEIATDWKLEDRPTIAAIATSGWIGDGEVLRVSAVMSDDTVQHFYSRRARSKPVRETRADEAG